MGYEYEFMKNTIRSFLSTLTCIEVFEEKQVTRIFIDVTSKEFYSHEFYD